MTRPKNFYVVVLLLLTLALTGLGLIGGDFWWPDESRHAMDGVFFLDLLKDRPIFNLYRYTEIYYAKYPALIFTWYPPFFAIAEAICYAMFGISVTTARLTVIFFALLGVLLWYRLISKMYNEELAFLSGLLFITTPVVVGWSRTVMLEVPTTAMVILCAYCFYHYFELEKKPYAYYLALSICAALHTKQHAAFILPAFLGYLVLKKKFAMLLRREALFSMGIIVVLMTPLAIFTWTFGKTGLSATVGTARKTVGPWLRYLQRLPTSIVTWPVLICAVLALLLILIRTKERRQYLFFVLWIGSWYVSFSAIFGIQRYYGVYVAPAFSLLAVVPLQTLRHTLCQKRSAKYLPTLAVIAMAGYQIMLACNHNEAFYIDSVYEEAAEFVLEQPKGSAVLVNAFYDGTFIFHVKRNDPDKKMIILRADKMLVSFAVHRRYGVPSYVETEEDIYNILHDYGIGYIVVEDELLGESSEIEALIMLRRMLDSENFTVVKEIPSTPPDVSWFCFPQKRHKDITLLIYEYKYMTPPQADELIIKFPHLGREIQVPFHTP